MRNHFRITVITIASASALGLFAAGCAGNSKDAPMKALRAEADDLTSQLSDTQRALLTAEEENARLQAGTQELRDQLAALESEMRREMTQLQQLRDSDAAAAAGRIRALHARIEALREEIEAKDAVIARQNADLDESARSISQLHLSVDTHRKQVADLEREKTALAGELQAAKRSRLKAMLGMGLVLVGAVVAGYLSRPARARRAEASEQLLRVNTAENRR